MREKKDRSGEPQSDLRAQTLMLTVSLFIALLAFFIVLNTFSNASAARLATIRNSLVDSFGFVGAGASMRAGEAGDGAAADAQEEAAAGLRSVLPDIGFASRATNSGGRVMSVRITRAEFEERWPALRARVGDVLANRNSGRRAVQILALDGPERAADLAAMAHELAEEGVDEALVSIGYEDAGSSDIELRFILSGS